MVQFANKLLIDVTVFLNSSSYRLVIPTKNQKHPLANKMNLLACLIPCKNFLTKTCVNIILRRWRPYSIYIKQWQLFCNKKRINSVLPPLTESINFLTRIYKSGVNYQPRSALKSLLNSETGVTIGKQETVKNA